MDSENAQWFYLQTIVGNFEGLIHFFFTATYMYGAWFRQGGFALIYGFGLVLIALNAIRSPQDRFKAAALTFVMVVAAGYLNSPPTNTSDLGPASGNELSVGGYYSYKGAAIITGIFSDILKKAMISQVKEAGGVNPGMTASSLVIAWEDRSKEFADKYLQGEGKQAYLDYQTKCAPEALSVVKTQRQKAILQAVGIGANTLGMNERDIMEVGKLDMIKDSSNFLGINTDGYLGYILPDTGNLVAHAQFVSDRRNEAKEFLLNELKESNNTFDSSQGYKIPSESYYKTLLDGEPSSNTDDLYFTANEGGEDFANMRANGLVRNDAVNEANSTFYPKNCHDLFLIADRTMANFRSGVKNIEDYKNVQDVVGFQAAASGALVRKAVNDQASQVLKDNGVDSDMSASLVETAGDYTMALFTSISKEINAWMLEFQIPALITGMALMVVILIISFPIFAVLSIIYGPRVLASYLKLMFFPFIVHFTTLLFLTLSTNIVAYTAVSELLTNTFNPGGSDAPSAMAAQNIKSIIFLLLTGGHIAIAKFVLWDDYRAVTSNHAGNATLNDAAKGAKVAGAAASTVLGVAGKGARIAAATKSRENVSTQTKFLSSINRSVNNAVSGNRERRPITPRGGNGGPKGGPSGRGGSSGGGSPSSPLNP